MLHTPYCDTIYQIKNDSTFFAKYNIKLKKSMWKLSEIKPTSEMSKHYSDGYTNIDQPFFETDDWLCFGHLSPKVINDGKKYLINSNYYYNKRDGKVYDLSSITALSPLILSPNYKAIMYNQCVGTHGNNFVFFVTESMVKSILKQKKEENMTVINQEFFDMCSETKNLAGFIVEFNYKLQ